MLNEHEVQNIAHAVAREIEGRGAPAGTWLFDIGRVRAALRDADGLLLRLEDAIVRSAETDPSKSTI